MASSKSQSDRRHGVTLGELPRCQNCRFSVERTAIRLECRRYAPRPLEATQRLGWPEVSNDDWCGEWEAQDAA